MSAQSDLKYTEAGKGEEEPSESTVYFQETPASEMVQIALLMCTVPLREAAGGVCVCEMWKAVITSAYLWILGIISEEVNLDFNKNLWNKGDFILFSTAFPMYRR